jgi:cell division protein FtsB
MSERLVFELQAVDRATAPIQNVQNKLSSLDGQLKRSTQQVRNLADESALANVKFQKWTKGSLQQAGYQIGDFAVQVANGTSKMQAFGQQAPQLLQVFGPAGAVIGAVVAIFAAFAVVAEKSAKAAKGQAREIISLSEALGKVNSDAEAAGKSIDVYLTRRFGEAAESVRELLRQIEKYNIGQLQDALQKELSGPMKNVLELTQTYSEMTAELDLMKESIDSINNTPIDQRMGGSNQTLRILSEGAAMLTQQLYDLENQSGVTVNDISKINKLLADIYKAESQSEIQDAFIELSDLVNQIGDTGLPGLSDALLLFAQKIGFTKTEFAALGEGITTSSDEAAESANNLSVQLRKVSDAVASINAKAIEKLSELNAQLRAKVRGLSDEQVRIQQAARSAELAAMAAGETGATELAAIAASAAQIERETIAAENALKGYATTSDKVAESANNLSVQLRKVSDAVASINTKAIEKLSELNAQLRARVRGLSDEKVRIQQAARAAELAAMAAGETGATELAAIAASAAQVERETIAAENALKGYATTAKKVGDTVAPVTEAIKYQFESIRKTISNSMEDAFMSMVDGTKKPIEAFKSMASAIIKELFRVLVVQRIVGSFGGGGILGGLGTIFPGLNATVPARASGGTVSGGRPYMVGEKGPELMVPGRTGTVVPNDQLSGGGVTVNQTINISTGVAQTVRSEIRALMPQIADNAKAAVLDAKRRGGAYGGAFA